MATQATTINMAGMGNTTPAKFFPLLLSFFVLTLSALLFYLAWPRWVSSFRYIPVETAIDSYYRTGEIPSERLPMLIEHANTAIDINSHYRFHNGLSLLQFLRAIDLATPAVERRSSYEASFREAAISLRSAPAQSSVWLRRAYLGWVLHEETDVILSAWKMAIFTGRTDQSQYKSRLEIGIAHRSFMDQEALAMLRDQLMLAWHAQPGAVVAVLAIYDRDMEVSRSLIAQTDPQALQEMEAWLEKIN